MYEFDDGTAVRRSGQFILNATGIIATENFIVGHSVRYSRTGAHNGYAAWVYSIATGTTTEILPSFNPSTLYASVQVTSVTETGVVLGTYYHNGSPTAPRAFIWTPHAGVHDLGATVSGGLTQAGWQQLSAVADQYLPGAIGTALGGSAQFVIGTGQPLGEPSSSSGLYRLTALPPACYPNCDASTATPVLSANDFQCFLSRFAAQDPYANCDGSTGSLILTANDFLCFLTAFARGCP